MRDDGVSWIIRNEKGQIRGPYKMVQVLRFISEGHLTGAELIAKYPDGQWTLISRDPEFYDKILEALEKQITPKEIPEVLDETVIIRPPEYSDRKKKQENIVKQVAEDALSEAAQKLAESARKNSQKARDEIAEPARQENRAESKPETKKARSENQQNSPVKRLSLPPTEEFQKSQARKRRGKKQKPKKEIQESEAFDSENERKPSRVTLDLSNIKELERKYLTKKTKPLFVALIGIIGIFLVMLFSSGETSSDKISLIIPQKNGIPLSEDQVREKTGSAVSSIQNDTYENYLEAENKLVALVEGSPNNLEVRGLLCFVYKELWPFSKQDASDLKALSLISQTTRVLNVANSAGNYCEAVKLYATGRFREARGTIDSILESEETSALLPMVYQFKAEILEADKDLATAIPYFEKASQYWKPWIKPKVSLGFALAKNVENATLAADYLRQVTHQNPKHKLAKIGLGLVEFKLFKNEKMALSTLSSAMNMTSKVPPLVESEAFVIMAGILFDQGDRSKAISMAEKGFVLNPNNEDVKKMCSRVGCSDRIKSKAPNKEMEALCDQFARSGDYLAAQAECKAAFDLEPKNGSAAMKAGKYLWALNQAPDAIEWLKKSIKAEPKLVSAYVLLADYLSQRYEFQAAAQILSEATKQMPNNFEILRGMALLELRKNNVNGAINYGQRSLKLFDADIDTYIILSKANRLLASALTGNKEATERDAAVQQAIRFATKAVELDGTNPEAQIAYAEMMATTSGIETGILYLREIIKKYPLTYEYRVALGDLMRSEERFGPAYDIYHQVAKQDPKNKKALLGLGLSQRALGKIDGALKSFIAAAMLDPSDAQPIFLMGKIYQEIGTFENSNKAIVQFKRALQVNFYYPQVHYNLGRTALMVGDLETALNEVAEEKKLNPNSFEAYTLSAEIYSNKKQYSECAAEYSIALKLRPQGADTYVKAAQCYRQSGSVEIAQDMLDLALGQESGNADIYKEQGVLAQLKRDSSAAILSLCKYLRLSPNALDREDIKATISRLGGDARCE